MLEKKQVDPLDRLLVRITNYKLIQILENEDAFRLYNKLDNEIFLSLGKESKPIIVASAQAGEGRTTIALLLASFSAAYDPSRKVLLIDGHLKGGDIGSFFEIHKKGKTELDNLHIITSNNRNGARIKLSHTRFTALIEEAKKLYDLIIVDSPPANISNDVISFAKVIKNVLLVVRYGGPNRQQIKRLVDDLKRAEANILGVVFNQREYHIPEFFYGAKKS